jgi:hypothetical protein
MNMNRISGRMRWSIGAAVLLASWGANLAQAQVPKDIEAELKKIGQIVDPACTAKLYRPLMPKNDFNTYWPLGAAAPVSKEDLYPGIKITRDQSFGPNAKDVVDIFVGTKGGGKRPVLIYVPGGGGNKVEQQVREGNAFYDNIGRWATKNGMVGVTVQRHPGTNWDDGGRDLSMAVDWIAANIAKYNGDPTKMVIWAHSAGNGPLGVYVGHPERWKNGVQVKGAIFNSGNPVPTVAPGGRGNTPAPGAPTPGSACGVDANMGSNNGQIAGPSGQTAPAGGRGPGGPGGPGGRGPELTAEQRAERDNLPGFKASKVKIMLAYAELDPGIVDAKMPTAAIALHDELCKLDGPNAKDGTGHCPTMNVFKEESHMSEVFSLDTPDQNVAGPVLAWIKKAVK